jgi:hypothetical protein
MAIRNVGGHAVSSSAPQHHQQAQASQPSFVDTQGPAAHNGGSKSGGNFPAKAAGKGRAQTPSEQSPPNAWAA